MTGRAAYWIFGIATLLLSNTVFTRSTAEHGSSSSTPLNVQEGTHRQRLLRKRPNREEIVPTSRFFQQVTTTTKDRNLSNESSRDSSDQSFGMEIPIEPTVLKDEDKAPRVVGGSNSGPDDAPFFVLIITWDTTTGGYKLRGCGGSLISNRHVLTAAHCAVGRNPQLDAVYVHAYQPYWGNPGVPFHYSPVASYTSHPNYNDQTIEADVAIITLSSPANVSIFPPIHLPPTALFQPSDGDIASVYGFGRLEYGISTQVTTLQVVDVPIVSPENCRKMYGPDRILDDMVCAGSSIDEKGSCHGDSGGPLIVRSNETAYQVGIVSWGRECGAINYPGVYASVQFYDQWIQGIVCETGETLSPLCDDDYFK